MLATIKRRIALSVVSALFNALPDAIRRGAQPVRILIIKPDHLGDMILASPALYRLHSHLPQAEIVVAASTAGTPAALRTPGVSRVETVSFPGLGREPAASALSRWVRLVMLARQWRGRFDAALLLRDDFYWGAALATLAGIPQRAGTATPECAPYLRATVPARREHAALHHLRVVSHFLGVETPTGWSPDVGLHFVPLPAREEVKTARAQAGLLSGEPYVLLHPGAGAPVKLWSAQAWSRVARGIAEDYGLRTVVVSGPQEEQLTAHIAHLAPEAALAVPPPLSLDALAALMQGARAVLGVDSGPLHLAAALDVPSIRLFGPADARVFGPWADPSRHVSLQSPLLCSPCDRLQWDVLDLPWHPCLRRISTASVRAAVDALFAATTSTA
ncbi:MAG: glycosyltransferase family 9 protein [Chloroflexi bacterium]|nr:glycosyltransferase family 9 protein [Chloroflexota bacterium]